ncbi:hypothetical protein K443DRAFT_125668 [Laccaria amethystina LaAM-08-1]|uniref:DDE Tnp4 domain-containing protein n=1 Tax=Laccaria amethystina LaAM-08-1 TaxID=1095629 RepID=A0A0C9WQ69_9AGAR|nr:hypothetical protein K443DRAFT_125668 [Laccaria amethystina LaAM-08-1]
MLLTQYKTGFPDIFCSYLRITPECFDSLLESIQHHEAFQNNSNNPHMPIERQLAIELYRFGHFGNGLSTLKVALWAGVGYGNVYEQMQEAKDWVEANSFPAWHKGWLMVDGTLIPMFQCPHHFGSAYFDRKSNYSENVQIINTPDLHIIDYDIGLPGSQHDATAWKHMHLPQEHQQLLKDGGFVWADSAYPVRTWSQAPYKE